MIPPLFALTLPCAQHSLPIELPGVYDGPDHTQTDLLRTIEGGNRIFVQGRLPDGELGLFMVDTGADISVLSEATATRLGLPIEENWGTVEGLSGTTTMDRAVLPQLEIGEAIVPDIEVAVGVAGLQERVGGMLQDGILGNNVWARFTLEIDYPADRMVLHRPGTMRLRGKCGALLLDDYHVLSVVQITTDADPPHREDLIIQIDTGAGDLLLSGASGQPFERDYSEGLEAVFGIGATETLAPYRFQQVTRRIPVDSVLLGGKTVKTDLEARWLNFDTNVPIGPAGLLGLVGHELLANHDVVFDFAGQQFQLRSRQHKKRQINGHRVLLEQDRERYGDDPSRALHRAYLYAGLNEVDEAIGSLAAYLELHPDDAEARVFLARLKREKSDLAGAWEALEPLSPGALVDEDEIVATVNTLLLEGDPERALELAHAAIEERPDDGWSRVARADVRLRLGEYEEARFDLLEAARLEEYPDAHLLRRARVAMADGDRYGAMAHIRKLVQLYPGSGQFLWFYATLIDDPEDADTFRTDMDAAMARLHPTRKPLDFLVASHTALGDPTIAATLMDEGIERDCDIPDRAERDNCYAWYWSLAHQHKDEALARIERALLETGDRPDFLDTKAMVHLARGEHELAYQSALAAARLSPEDIYMLWQAERIGAMREHPDAGACYPSPCTSSSRPSHTPG